MINWGIIINVVGVLLILFGTFMLTVLPFSFYYGSNDLLAIVGSSLLTILAGLGLWASNRNPVKSIGKREGFLIVSVAWMAISIFNTLPYILSDVLPSFTNALFESVSGLTTTGASVIDDIEAVPKGILFWRSLTQWLGGMGIIVLTVAIFPILGIGGVELFVNEAPGPTSDKIHPRIKETAKRLWFIYLGLTGLVSLLLFLEGMNFFDALNHGLTTMATGGFSTKNASIAYFESPLIQYTIALFMLLGGVNYTIIYFSLKGKFKRVWASDEFRAYLIFISVISLLVTLVVYNVTGNTLEQSFRDSFFQVISIVTTTGFISADYTSWTPFITLLFFNLLFVGACAGSTSGGVKIIRHLVVFKNSLFEFKRLLHPKAIIRTKIDGSIVAPRIQTHILVFLFLYMVLFVFGSILMTFVLRDFEEPLVTAIGSVATSLGNVGPSIGELGPVDNFSQVPSVGKWILVFLMLLGRLELFTILVLFSPFFWRSN